MTDIWLGKFIDRVFKTALYGSKHYFEGKFHEKNSNIRFRHPTKSFCGFGEKIPACLSELKCLCTRKHIAWKQFIWEE